MNTKAFTLIELVVTVVILGLIALISTPIIINMIDSTKQKTAFQSTTGIFESANLYYSNAIMNGSFDYYTCDFASSNCNELNYHGIKPDSGSISIDEEGIVNATLTFKNHTYYICSDEIKDEVCEYE